MPISLFRFPHFKKVIARNKSREHSLTAYFDPDRARPGFTVRNKLVPITVGAGSVIGLWFEMVKVEETDASDVPNIWIKIGTTRCFPAVTIGYIRFW